MTFKIIPISIASSTSVCLEDILDDLLKWLKFTIDGVWLNHAFTERHSRSWGPHITVLYIGTPCSVYCEGQN